MVLFAHSASPSSTTPCVAGDLLRATNPPPRLSVVSPAIIALTGVYPPRAIALG